MSRSPNIDWLVSYNNVLSRVYHIVFRTYGTWLIGDSRGSKPHGRVALGHTPRLWKHERDILLGSPVILKEERSLIDETIRKECNRFQWFINALNVRQNHVHLVITIPTIEDPQRVLRSVKYASTKILHEKGYWIEQSIWAEKGYVKKIRSREAFQKTIQYVENQDHDDNADDWGYDGEIDDGVAGS